MPIANVYRSLLAQGRALLARLPPLNLRARAVSIARIIAGFFLTLVFLAALGAVFLAAQSRVRFEPPASKFTFATGRSAALQAVEHLFALKSQHARSMDETRVFEPGARRFRENHIQAGAQGAALEFIEEVRPARGVRNADFSELLSLAADPADPVSIAAAAQRVNAAVARGGMGLDWDGDVFERLLLKAAERLEARAADIATLTHNGHFGVVPSPAEAAFFEARGEAYGWALILRGAAVDSHARASPDFAQAIDALNRAANLEPLFLFNGPRDNVILPNHLSHIALDLELAADALRRAAGA